RAMNGAERHHGPELYSRSESIAREFWRSGIRIRPQVECKSVERFDSFFIRLDAEVSNSGKANSSSR
ncbi:hypothetical protein ACFU98_47665, partial [Streptomyces sp. NPDC057575]